VKVFLADRGAVAQAEAMEYPLDAKKVQRRIDRMGRFLAEGASRTPDEACRWRMGLVARSLFVGPSQGGLLVRWRSDLSAEEVGRAIASCAGELGLSKKKPQAGKSESVAPEDAG